MVIFGILKLSFDIITRLTKSYQITCSLSKEPHRFC